MRSELDVEVYAYLRTADGFLTSMHDLVPTEGGIHQVVVFNPASNRNQVSRLRLVNPNDVDVEVRVRRTRYGRQGRGVAKWLA